jgi:hypothetical protein
MKVGALVECINDTWKQKTIETVPNRPIKGKYYTIRTVNQYTHGIGVTLEEVTNARTVQYQGQLLEPSFDAGRFRELTDLPDIEELLEEVFAGELTEK